MSPISLDHARTAEFRELPDRPDKATDCSANKPSSWAEPRSSSWPRHLPTTAAAAPSGYWLEKMLRIAAAARGRSRAAAAAAGALSFAVAAAGAARPVADAAPYAGAKRTAVRDTDFPLTHHHHGKARVRVLKVRRSAARHEISEFTVNTRLFSSEYAKVFTANDNADLVATDTQKNTVYIVAKRTACETPEQFGIDMAEHLLREYPILSAVEVDVAQAPWSRVVVDGAEHDHGFVRGSNERAEAKVRLERGGSPQVVSTIEDMTVLKTTQSGFEGYMKDQYTLLPECEERCLATELSAYWTYLPGAAAPDYAAVRTAVRTELTRGIFGPAAGGVYSASLQATIYDAACLVLKAASAVAQISISTPNLHYLPCRALGQLGESFDDDVFIPTSEPSGTISCTVGRQQVRCR
jgi:urate oxidase